MALIEIFTWFLQGVLILIVLTVILGVAYHAWKPSYSATQREAGLHLCTYCESRSTPLEFAADPMCATCQAKLLPRRSMSDEVKKHL